VFWRGAAAAAVLTLAACDAEPTEPMTRAQFIDVMTELRKIDMDTDAPEEFDARRDSILREAGVTDSTLVDFARLHGRDIVYMAEVWDSIATRLAVEDTIMR
jgi:hypothetical protein